MLLRILDAFYCHVKDNPQSPEKKEILKQVQDDAVFQDDTEIDR
jgi:hypothetical protein